MNFQPKSVEIRLESNGKKLYFYEEGNDRAAEILEETGRRLQLLKLFAKIIVWKVLISTGFIDNSDKMVTAVSFSTSKVEYTLKKNVL